MKNSTLRQMQSKAVRFYQITADLISVVLSLVKAVRFYQITAALIFVVLSLVKEVKLGDFILSGGSGFLALAALMIFYPLVMELASRGGTAEFLGLKVQLNALEKKGEQEFGIRIEELRVDLEKLRSELQERLPHSSQAKTLPSNSVDDRIFCEAIATYNSYDSLDNWSHRVEADKKLAIIAGTLPVIYLREVLSKSPSNQGIAMAVAVVLGVSQVSEAVESAKLLAEMLFSSFERARYRAARSVERRSKRADLLNEERTILLQAVNKRLEQEPAQVVRDALKLAQQVLTVNYSGSGTNKVQNEG